MSSKAERESNNLVRPTCREIDSAMSELMDVVKTATGDLRQALTEKCDECNDLENQIEVLEDLLKTANNKIEELENVKTKC